MKKALSVLGVFLFLVGLAILLFFSLADPPASAQYPKPGRRPVSTPEIAKHLSSARFTRVVVVDSSGGSDYKTISDALAFIAKKDSSQRNWTSLEAL